MPPNFVGSLPLADVFGLVEEPVFEVVPLIGEESALSVAVVEESSAREAIQGE